VRHQMNIAQVTSRARGFTESALIERSNRKIVGPVRYEFVTERFADLRAMNQKDTRHAFDVAIGCAEKIAVCPCDEQSGESAGIQILVPLGANEAKCFVKTAIGVRKPGHVAKVMRGKELFCPFLGRQVNKRELRSERFNPGAKLFDFAYGFAAKCATEVAEENQQEGTVLRQSRDVSAVLRQIGRRNCWQRTCGERHG